MKTAATVALVGLLLAGPLASGGLVSAASTRLLRSASLLQQAPPKLPVEEVGGISSVFFSQQLPSEPPNGLPLLAARQLAAAEEELPSLKDPLEESLEVARAVCLQDDAGRTFVHAKNFNLPEMQLWYQFDKSLPVDESGHGRHLMDEKSALTPLVAGPGILGHGASAALDGQAYRTVHAPEAMNSPAFTITLWLYLREDSLGAWRTIFCRGSGPEELRPALLLAPDERRLHVRASPRAQAAGGALDASGVLPLRRWTHIAVVYTCSVLRLYINGVKDGEVILEEPLGESDGTLYIGRDPWRAGTKAFLDDFRWYSREVTPTEIGAMLYPGLTGIAASDSISLACASCTFPEAVRACDAKRATLCSMQGLFSGGYHTARVMGWLTGSSEVWYHEEEGDEVFEHTEKLGLCCLE